MLFKSFAPFVALLSAVSAAPLQLTCQVAGDSDDTPVGAANNTEYSVVDCSTFLTGAFDTFSCHNTTAIPETDSCCFENWGVLMQTQFWDYNSSYLSIVTSADNDTLHQLEAEIQANVANNPTGQVFTIHGLWNDLCDGSYNQYCNPSLEINDDKDNITHVIVDVFGETELFNKMAKYWLNNEKSNVNNAGSIDLWEHEYNKHGTCMNTLLPKCFTGKYTKFENTVSFYKKVVELWENYSTYQFLQQFGITPTLLKQYKLSDVQTALAQANNGKQVYVGCLKGAIDEIWYYNNLKGNVLTGEYQAIDSLTPSTCGEYVWYLPK
ncbi:ribonuclease T2 precursor [Scheffersomyces xylosifermentans]|uniref:ribonuclease T2 precursor n=1 Tax=Scheffersomyces xylosifermentans TaxID=1304137 RepID=UPI00315C9B56